MDKQGNDGGGILQVKTVLSESGNEVINYLPLHYEYVLTEDALSERNALQCLTLRCSLDTMDQVSSWLQVFQTKSHTRWIVGRCAQEPTRFIFRRQWLCHHSAHNKGKTLKSKSTNCRAKIDFKIKKQTCDTKKKDEFLRLIPPLPTIIKIYYDHNHTTEFVVKREQLLADFAATQLELKSEMNRLQGLILKGKPGLSAMKQFLNQLKTIKTEAELFESMRKVRLKPTVFPRIGRPPKNRSPEVALVRKAANTALRPRKTFHRNRTTPATNGILDSVAASATLVALDQDAVLTEEDPEVQFHTLEEVETEQTTTTIDISYLFAQ